MAHFVHCIHARRLLPLPATRLEEGMAMGALEILRERPFANRCHLGFLEGAEPFSRAPLESSNPASGPIIPFRFGANRCVASS